MNNRDTSGFLLIHTILIVSIAMILVTGLFTWAAAGLRGAQNLVERERAFQIAEAGTEYYRWHLAHDATDYEDGTGAPGPYVHDFEDKDGTTIGQFSLTITAPILGSTLVTVESTGSTLVAPAVTRTVIAQLAKPSLAKYAVIADNVMRFGSGTVVFGEIHSNDGIRFDGYAHNIVRSAEGKYDDPDHSGSDEWAVHTHVSPTDSLPPDPIPPSPTLPNRPDVFAVGREVEVPVIGFDSMTGELAIMEADALTADGFWRGPATGEGYRISFNGDGTFDLFDVDSTEPKPGSCWQPGSQDGWGTWSIDSETQVLDDEPLPVNGIMYFNDDIWLDGQINGQRLTVVAAVLPASAATYKSATINNDLLYSAYDGTDVIGIIAQKNINVGLRSEDDLQIDAALIAQFGRVGRYYYESDCGTGYDRDTLTLNGMIGTANRYGFAYTDGTGYDVRNLNYDSNLLYGPPPSFPLASDEYEIVSWEAD